MFQSAGWRQILTARKEILDAYDRAREQSRAHEIEIFHGRVAEASCRKWLASFLPKRFGVTSGYIISPSLAGDARSPHFDVIIYDQLDAPILWIEESADHSAQGRSLAIPVEFVRAVIEVKAQLSAETMKRAISHLQDLVPFASSVDEPDAPFRMHLPPNFCCGVFFMELRADQSCSELPLLRLAEGAGLKGLFGVVLRAEGHTEPRTGLMSLFTSDIPHSFPNANVQLRAPWSSDTIPLKDGRHVGAAITWEESHFSQFAFGLIAMMQGTYRKGRLTTLYGMGSTLNELIEKGELTREDFL